MRQIILLLIIAAFAAGCSKKPQANACSLFSVSEAQSLDGSVVKTEFFPAGKGETNEICTYLDNGGERRVMLFWRNDKSIDPLDTVRSGMKEPGSKVIELSGVGEKAAAGFRDGELKLFNARSAKGMIGLRVRDAVKEGDEKFEKVKTLAATALSRVK